MDLELAFVDSITASAATRLDLAADPWAVQVGTRFDPPPLKYASHGTLLVDGEHISASAFGNRSIMLRLKLLNVTEDQTATHLQSLMRELNRPTNILRYRPGTTHPVFFQTIRAGADAVTFDAVEKEVTVSIPAKPFALGPKETLGGPLNSNPYFETDVSNWTPAGGTAARSTAQFHEGAASLLLTPDGVSAQAVARAELVPATAGLVYRASVWVRCAVARNVAVTIDWHSGGVLFSGSGNTVAVAANTWTLLAVTAAAPATTDQARLTVSMDSTPPAGHLLHIDEAILAQSFTVNNDPAASVNGMFFDVTGIQGDVETPLFLRMGSGSAPSGDLWQPVVAVRRRGTPSAAPFFLQAELFPVRSADTSLPGNDAAMSGAGSNYARTTFATLATMSGRISLGLGTPVWPTSPSVDVRGTYRVFARVRKSSASDGIAVRLRYAPGAAYTAMSNAKASLANHTGLQYVDLGLLQMPIGDDPVTDGSSGTELPVRGAFFSMEAERTSGAGTLDIDFLLFVPADDRILITTWQNLAPTTVDGFIVDSGGNRAYAVGSSGEVLPGTVTSTAPGFPLVSPGVTNRIALINHTAQVGATADSISKTTSVTPYYWPRYLHVKPAST